jgi:hypothetical protein
LAQQVTPEDAVVFNAGVTAICVKVYDDMSYHYVTYPENYSILDSGYQGSSVTIEHAETLIHELERRYQGLWLVEFWPHWWDPQGLIQERIGRTAVTEREWQFRGLRVRYFRFAVAQQSAVSQMPER